MSADLRIRNDVRADSVSGKLDPSILNIPVVDDVTGTTGDKEGETVFVRAANGLKSWDGSAWVGADGVVQGPRPAMITVFSNVELSTHADVQLSLGHAITDPDGLTDGSGGFQITQPGLYEITFDVSVAFTEDPGNSVSIGAIIKNGPNVIGRSRSFHPPIGDIITTGESHSVTRVASLAMNDSINFFINVFGSTTDPPTVNDESTVAIIKYLGPPQPFN